MCVSSKHVFAVCVCVYVDLSVGGAAVSTDDGVHNIKKKEEEEEELETGRKDRRREG